MRDADAEVQGTPPISAAELDDHIWTLQRSLTKIQKKREHLDDEERMIQRMLRAAKGERI